MKTLSLILDFKVRFFNSPVRIQGEIEFVG